MTCIVSSGAFNSTHSLTCNDDILLSERTYILSGGALNSTHSLTHFDVRQQTLFDDDIAVVWAVNFRSRIDEDHPCLPHTRYSDITLRLKCKHLTPILAVVFVFQGKVVTKKCGLWKNFAFTCHKFLLVTVKEWLKSVLNYRSYPKNKTGYPFFGPPCRNACVWTLAIGRLARIRWSTLCLKTIASARRMETALVVRLRRRSLTTCRLWTNCTSKANSSQQKLTQSRYACCLICSLNYQTVHAQFDRA